MKKQASTSNTHTQDKICSKCKTGARFAYLDSANTLCPWIRLLNGNKCRMFEPIDDRK